MSGIEAICSLPRSSICLGVTVLFVVLMISSSCGNIQGSDDGTTTSGQNEASLNQNSNNQFPGQSERNTVALFHFDTSPSYVLDSSLYSGIESSTLTDSGTTLGVTAMYGQSRLFTRGLSNCMSASHTSSHSSVRNKMTVEAQVRFTSLPGGGISYTILSKMGASGQFGWEFGVTRIGGSRYLYFSGSLDGIATTQVTSSPIALSTVLWKHVGVTWDTGTIKFYYDGVAVGSGNIGTPGSATLFDSTASLRVGCTQTGNHMDGQMDEVRLSQSVRWDTSFTPPSLAYTGD